MYLPLIDLITFDYVQFLLIFYHFSSVLLVANHESLPSKRQHMILRFTWKLFGPIKSTHHLKINCIKCLIAAFWQKYKFDWTLKFLSVSRSNKIKKKNCALDYVCFLRNFTIFYARFVKSAVSYCNFIVNGCII